MKNILFILALAVSAGLNIYLYQRFVAADQARQDAEQRFTACQQVTFQLQNQLTQQKNSNSSSTVTIPLPTAR